MIEILLHLAAILLFIIIVVIVWAVYWKGVS